MRFHHIAALIALAGCTQTPAQTSAEVEARYTAATQAYENDLSTFERTAAPNETYQGNLTPLADYLRAVMRQREGADVRELAAIYLATLPNYGTTPSAEDFAEIAATVPPTSPRWSVAAQDSIRRVAENLEPQAARSFLEAIATQHPDRATQAWALVRLTELDRRQNRAAYPATYARLAPYIGEEGLRFPVRDLNPENAIAIGKQAPAFTLRELGTDRVVSSESLRGRYYLLDFWATWCGPCVSERANINRAQERFGGDDFTVVSISVDNTPQEAIQFRQRRWPMNWLNLYAPGSHYSEEDFGFGGDVAQNYEITWKGVPQLILVSPEGEILALRDELDGPMLERTLSRYLGAPT